MTPFHRKEPYNDLPLLPPEATSEEIKARLPKGHSKGHSKELIEILFRLPYSKRQFLIEANMGTTKTVGNYLITLGNKGFLKATKVGKEKLYLN